MTPIPDLSWSTARPLVSLAALLAVAAQTPDLLAPRKVKAGGREIEVLAGTVRVPEDRSKPEGARVDIAVGVLKCRSEDPGPPLFFLAGGPGDSATEAVSNPLWDRCRELGDVVLVDQRGTGRTRPDIAWKSPDIDARLVLGERDAALQHALECAQKAAADLRSRGVDVAAYTTSASADDLDAVREKLGYAKIHLLGHSYGTHLALEMMRRHGDRVDRAVLVGVAGPDDLLKPAGEVEPFLKNLSRMVAEDPKIGKAVPDLHGLALRCLDRVAREPLEVQVRDPRTDGTVAVEVGRLGLQIVLLRDLGDTSDLPVFPRLLVSVEKGDPSLLAWFVQKRYSRAVELPVMSWAVRAASGVSRERRERIERDARTSPFGDARNFPFPEIGEALGVKDLGEEFRKPVSSDVPVLMISGTLDANTPPEQAERARKGLKNAVHLVVENAGHEDLVGREDVDRRVIEFLSGKALKDERIARPKLEFVPLEGDHPSPTHPAVEGARR